MIWNPNHPAPSSYVSDLASVTRANKVVLDDSMQTTFYWSDSVASAGEPRISTTTPGSYRVFYGLESQVSYPGYDGTMMYAHDTGKLWALNSNAPAPVSSTKIMHGMHQSQDAATANTTATTPSRNMIAIGRVDVGAANVKDTGLTVDFGTDFAESPNMMITLTDLGTGRSAASYTACIIDVTTADFQVGVDSIFASDPATASIFWRASGYTTLIMPLQAGIA